MESFVKDSPKIVFLFDHKFVDLCRWTHGKLLVWNLCPCCDASCLGFLLLDRRP